MTTIDLYTTSFAIFSILAVATSVERDYSSQLPWKVVAPFRFVSKEGSMFRPILVDALDRAASRRKGYDVPAAIELPGGDCRSSNPARERPVDDPNPPRSDGGRSMSVLISIEVESIGYRPVGNVTF